jgi:hypothetical protein
MPPHFARALQGIRADFAKKGRYAPALQEVLMLS